MLRLLSVPVFASIVSAQYGTSDHDSKVHIKYQSNKKNYGGASDHSPKKNNYGGGNNYGGAGDHSSKKNNYDGGNNYGGAGDHSTKNNNYGGGNSYGGANNNNYGTSDDYGDSYDQGSYGTATYKKEAKCTCATEASALLVKLGEALIEGIGAATSDNTSAQFPVITDAQANSIFRVYNDAYAKQLYACCVNSCTFTDKKAVEQAAIILECQALAVGGTGFTNATFNQAPVIEVA